MKIFDLNIHLYSKETGELSDQLRSNTELTAQDLINGFEKCEVHLTQSAITAANFMLFNQQITADSRLNDFFKTARDKFPLSSFTLLFDFRSNNIKDLVFQAKTIGFSFIKFHAYTQQITESDYNNILIASKFAEELGLGICIDASFGTTGLYKYDNLKLAAYLADSIKKAPIILLHSGGARVFDAMLIADHNPNIYLETSLSLDFYRGSTLLQDFAYAYKKLGLHRILYASDYPYQKADEAIADLINLSDRYGISDTDKENIFYNNAIQLIHSLG